MKKDFQNDIALLKEMISGLEKESKEKAILASMIDVMEKLNDKVDSYYKDLEEYVDSVDRDLSEVKLDMYGLEEDFKEELDEELNIEDDKEKKIVNNIHNPQNLLMHQKQFDSIIDNVVPILTKVICEGIEKGIFNTDYPLETVEMILIYTQTVFDSNNNLSMEETLRKISAFIVNLERLLGAEKGSFDFIKQVFN